MENHDEYFWYRMKRALILLFVIITLIGLYIIAKCESVEAAEVEQDQSEETTETDTSTDVETVDVSTEFGFYTQPQEVEHILTKIYNLLLTMFYFKIIDTGRQIIVRNIRKGHMDGGLVE